MGFDVRSERTSEWGSMCGARGQANGVRCAEREGKRMGFDVRSERTSEWGSMCGARGQANGFRCAERPRKRACVRARVRVRCVALPASEGALAHRQGRGQRYAGRHAGSHAGSHAGRHAGRHAGSHAGRHADSHTGRYVGRYVGRHTDSHAGRGAGRGAGAGGGPRDGWRTRACALAAWSAHARAWLALRPRAGRRSAGGTPSCACSHLVRVLACARTRSRPRPHLTSFLLALSPRATLSHACSHALPSWPGWTEGWLGHW